jgi:hypothetical protein
MQGCRQFRESMRTSRRDFLRAGMFGAGSIAGLSLADVLRAEALEKQPAAGKRVNSVIILWMRGGPSHIDMWDMKPAAPLEYRGEFLPIATKVPGINICELLPQTAACMDKWSIIRSLSGDPGHSGQMNFTGYPDGPDSEQNYHPSCGSIAAEQLRHLNPALPTYVMIPKMVPGTNSAYLAAACRPFETQADPASATEGFKIPNLGLPEGLSVGRFLDRGNLLRSMDAMRRHVAASDAVDAMDTFQHQAWDICTSPATQQAFDLDAEPQALRERYGIWDAYKARDPQGGGAPNWPQRILLARRLVEAGVRLVTVDCRWWDTHQDNFWSLKTGFLPRWDRAYSALIEDLDQRGLLETTMVIAWGEMGRSPLINTRSGTGRGGRDHWGPAMAAAVAGGGIKGGRVIGSTDAKAEVPRDNPKERNDVLATMYRHLGIDTAKNYLDLAGRPFAVLPSGKPIDELF